MKNLHQDYFITACRYFQGIRMITYAIEATNYTKNVCILEIY